MYFSILTILCAIILIIAVEVLCDGDLGVDAAQEIYWTFSWPYAEDGTCNCHEAHWGEYQSEVECKVAFAASPHEYCKYMSHGVTQKDCNLVISMSTNYDNYECFLLCDRLAHNESVNSAEFYENCSFEGWHVQGGQVKVEGNCFDNYVYGHSDSTLLSGASVAIAEYQGVHYPKDCQYYCQTEPSCVNWLWRRYPDDGMLGTERGNMPFACFLKSLEEVKRAASTTLRENVAFDELPVMTEYCDKRKEGQCGVPLTFGEENQCLRCSCDEAPLCIWKSHVHISGPKYCHSKINPCEEIPTETPAPPPTPERTPPEEEQPPIECAVDRVDYELTGHYQGSRIATITGTLDSVDGLFRTIIRGTHIQGLIRLDRPYNEQTITLSVTPELVIPKP